MKLGKKPAAPQPTDLLYSSFLKPGVEELPIAPVGFGKNNGIDDRGWGMLGNDSVGDCVIAGGGHETMLWNKLAGKDVPFSESGTLSDYTAITGYNPANPDSDQGTDPHVALNYRRSTGLVDAKGSRHVIGGYVSLEPGDWHQMLQALHIFDAVGIGIAVYDYAMDQFNQGKPWALRKSSAEPKLLGYHYVPIVARPHVATIGVITWGQLQLMTRAFYHSMNDEAYGILSEESLKNGKTREGYDLDALRQAIKTI